MSYRIQYLYYQFDVRRTLTVYDAVLASQSDDYKIERGEMELTVNGGALSFTLPPNHPARDIISVRTGIVKVLQVKPYETDETVFIGDVIRITENFDKSLDIECEGALSFFNDALLAPHSFPAGFSPAGNVVEWWLSYLLDRYNLQSTITERHINLGTVTVESPANYIERINDSYSTVYETLVNDFINSELGGYFVTRFVGDTIYLDYLANFEDSDAVIQFGENLLSFGNTIDGTDYFNSVTPIGKDGLTLISLPDGQYSGYTKSGNALYDPTERAEHGGIARLVQFDVDNVNDLLLNAIGQLQRAGIPKSFEVSAADLSEIEDAIPFEIGTNVRVISSPHGIDIMMPLSSMTVNILDPIRSTITLGVKATTASGRIAQNGAVSTKPNGFDASYNGVIAASGHAATDGTSRGIIRAYDANGDLAAQVYGNVGYGGVEIFRGGTMRAALRSNANGGYLRLYNADGSAYKDLTYNTI